MRSGIVSERATWAPRIGAIVSGSLLAFLNGKLAPTPVAEDGNRSGDVYGNGSQHVKGWAAGLIPTPISSDGLGGGALEDPEAAMKRSPRRGQKLQDMLSMLPTPTANRYGTNSGGQNPGPARPGLDTLATKGLLPTPMATRSGMNAKLLDLLPTPVASDSEGTRNRTSCRKPGSKHHDVETLCDRLVGTPTASDHASGEVAGGPDSRLKAQVRGPLSPSLHLWLMGWPEGASNFEPVAKESFRLWLRSHGIG